MKTCFIRRQQAAQRCILLALLFALSITHFASPHPAQAEPVPLTDTEFAPVRIEKLINEYVTAHAPRGGVVVGVHYARDRLWLTAGDTDSQDPVIGPETMFEIGSLTKSLVGLWAARLIDDELLNPTATVAELWPAGDRLPDISETELATRTIEELLTHSSGLPRLRLSPLRLLRTLIRLDDPYAGLSDKDLLRDAAAVGLRDRGTFQYSNLGYALAGELLRLRFAEHSETDATDLAELVSVSLLSPLGTEPVQLSTPTLDRSTMPQGYAENGRKAPPWNFDGYSAAGGMVASPRQLLEIATAVLNDPDAFSTAIAKRAPAGENRGVGLGWLIEDAGKEDTLVWHNGGTGGFRSFLGLVPDQGVAVVVVANSAVSVDPLARAVLSGDSELPERQTVPLSILLPSAALAIGVGVGITQLAFQRPRDLVSQLTRAVSIVIMAAIMARFLPATLYTRWFLPAVILVVLALALTGTVRHAPLPLMVYPKAVKTLRQLFQSVPRRQ